MEKSKAKKVRAEKTEPKAKYKYRVYPGRVVGTEMQPEGPRMMRVNVELADPKTKEKFAEAVERLYDARDKNAEASLSIREA